jgi:hypothetical protein
MGSPRSRAQQRHKTDLPTEVREQSDPAKRACFLVGDSEFGSIAVLQQLKQWCWFFVLRQKGNTGLWLNEPSGWQRLDSLVQKAGQSAWCLNGYLTQSEIYPVSVLIY